MQTSSLRTAWRFLLLDVLFIVPVMYVMAAMALILGIPLQPWLMALAWVGVYGVGLILTLGDDLPHRWLGSLLGWAGFTVLVLILLGITLQCYDVFYDSQAYHGPAILYISQGWNIYHDPLQTPAQPVNTMKVVYAFAKSSWLTSAMIYQVVGNLEATHLLNVLVFFSAGWVSWAFFGEVLGFRRWRRGLFAGLLAANPIITTQLFSGYNDGLLAAGLTVIFFSLVLVFHARTSSDTPTSWPGPRIYFLLALAYLPFVINLKFTGLLYGGLLGLTAWVYAWVQGVAWKTLLRSAGWLIAVGILSVLVFGYNPYVVNTLVHHNPVYPAFDPKTGRTIEDKQVVPEFREKNRLAKLLIANFSLSSGQNPKRPMFHMPFTPPYFPAAVAGRYSGFGAYFGLALLLSLPLLVFIRRPGPWVLMVGILLSVLATDVGWWARLAPQFWWLPILITAYALEKRAVFSGLGLYGAGILALLILSAGSMGLRTWQHQFLNYRALVQSLPDRDLTYVQTDQRMYLYSLQRLQDLGYHLSPAASCEHTFQPPLIRGIAICEGK